MRRPYRGILLQKTRAIGHLYPLQENMIFVGVTPRGYPGHAQGHAPTQKDDIKTKKRAIGHLYPLWVYEPTICEY
jgi:hypothetical protein